MRRMPDILVLCRHARDPPGQPGMLLRGEPTQSSAGGRGRGNVDSGAGGALSMRNRRVRFLRVRVGRGGQYSSAAGRCSRGGRDERSGVVTKGESRVNETGPP